MLYKQIVSLLAQEVKSQMAQSAFINSKHQLAIRLLGKNKNLTKASWFKLINKAPAELAYDLVNADLDEEQLKLALEDKRITVRQLLFYTGLPGLTPKIAEDILGSSYFDSNLAMHWLYSGKVPAEYLNRVARVEAGHLLLKALADPEVFTFDEAVEILNSNKCSYLGKSTIPLWQLFDKRPELIVPAIDSARSEYLSGISGSRHLFDSKLARRILEASKQAKSNPIASASAINISFHPNLSWEVRNEAIAVSKELSKSIRYSGMFRNVLGEAIVQSNSVVKPAPNTQPWETLTGSALENVKAVGKLLDNRRYPTLTLLWKTSSAPNQIKPDQKEYSLKKVALSDIYLSQYKQVDYDTVRYITPIIESELNALGELAWQTFISLSEEWTEDLQSLLNTVKSLSK